MTDELIGKQIGGYEILNQIGQGGMATVYRAQQISMNRVVAIKVLPRQFLNDDTYLQRFEREVQIVSQLEHRNIVPVHDYGQHSTGQPYIVMRYMPAGSIDDLLQRGPLEGETILNILEQVAPALDYAHTKNVLHRDLKPSNVLMDDNGGAFITDFGIARILGEQGPGITTQGVVGTPSYMSPEQAQAHALDGRSDVYSLGVMLFEMLTGRRPFESDTPYSIAVLQVTAPPPAPRSYNPSIPQSVERVVYKALKKNPNERYSTAVDLADALRDALADPQRTHDTPPHPFIIPASLRPPAPLVQQAALPPAVAPSPPVSYPAVSPPSIQPTYYPPVSESRSQSIPPPAVANRLRKRRGGGMAMNVAVGGMIGCALLAVLVLLAALVVNAITQGSPPPLDATHAPDEVDNTALPISGGTHSVPELDATSASARETLLPGSRATPLTPTIPPTADQPTATRIAALEDVRGLLVYFDDVQDKGFEIVTLDIQSGVGTQLTDDNSSNSYPTASPDGKWIAYQSDRDGDFDIYVSNPVGGDLIKITYNPVLDRLPAWSPDGKWIVFSSDTRGDGNYDLFRVHPNGTNLEPLFSNGQRNSHARYSPDGRYIVFTTGNKDNAGTWDVGRLDLQTGDFKVLTRNDTKEWSPSYTSDGKGILYLAPGQGDAAIWRMDADGGNPRMLFDGPGYEWGANTSPDSGFIVFNTNVSGRDELYLMTADGQKVQQITDTGGMFASWIPKK